MERRVQTIRTPMQELSMSCVTLVRNHHRARKRWSRSHYLPIALLCIGTGCTGGERDRSVAVDPSLAVAVERVNAASAESAKEKGDWKPAEFRTGRGRWRDCGVYVDGKPVGFLFRAELPPRVKPSWKTQRRHLPFGPGEKRKTETYRVPRYRFADYLQALGIELESVSELHLHGGRGHVIVVSGKHLRERPDEVLFRFSGDTSGKPLPVLGPNVDANTSFDNIASVSVYAQKPPPRLNAADRVELQGKPVHDVPYFGTPLRGGVRVYLNDSYAGTIKRRVLNPPEGIHPLASVLQTLGVTMADVRAAQIIYGDERRQVLEGEALADLQFRVDGRARGKILLGPERVPANALALYTAER